MKTPRTRWLAGLLLLAPTPVAVAAQAADHGVLIIRAGDRDVGSETYQVAPDSAGVRYTARSVFGGRPPTELTVTLDRQADGELAFQLDRQAGPGSGKLYAVQKGRRITVRRVDREVEQASELPGGPDVVLLADSVFSLYLQVAAIAVEGGGAIPVVFPQGPRRARLTVRRSAEPGGSVVRFGGDISGEMHLGHDGELLRILLPALGLEAVRKPE